MKKLLSVIIVVSVLVLFLFFGKNLFMTKKTIKPSSYNLIVITIDTLRADRLGCYGFEKNTSPAIDGFSEKGLLFENVIVPAPLTGPSHSSIFTGKHIINHGVLSNGYKLPDENITLAEVLKDKGYSTAAFLASKVLSKEHNYNQGFDIYKGGEVFERKADAVRKDLLEWVESKKDESFFAWAHFYDAHCPYYAPDEFREKFKGGYKGTLNTAWKCSKAQYSKMKLSADDINYVRSMYEAEISYIDSNIGKIFDKIQEWGLNDNTIIVVTSDHGESLNEKGTFGHNRCLYDYEVKAPLIIYYPGITRVGEREKSQVQNFSIMPTILDIMKIPFNEKIDGKSFYPLFTGGTAGDEVAYSTRVVRENNIYNLKEHSLRTLKWKLIVKPDGEEELYDLADDPDEIVNIISKKDNIEEVSTLFKNLYSVIEKDEQIVNKKTQKISEKTVRDLKTLGYLQ